MNANVRAVSAVVLSTIVLGACATKGFVRTQVANERAARDVADSTIRAQHTSDIAAVRSEVESVRNDLQSLRADLGALRTEFGARITAMEEGIKFAFPVTFAYDDATVRETDKPALDRFAQVAQKYYGESKITVEGFADPAGSVRYNEALSKRRADAVAAYLIEKGMNNGNLRTVGYGKTRQVNPGAKKDDAGAEQNRRVVFVIETKGAEKAVAMDGQQP